MEEDVDAVLALIQHRFDPVGIASRDVRETLLIWLSRNLIFMIRWQKEFY